MRTTTTALATAIVWILSTAVAAQDAGDIHERRRDFSLAWTIPAVSVGDIERDVSCFVSFYSASAPHIMISSHTEYDPPSEMVFFEVHATSVSRGGWLLDQWSTHEFAPWDQRLYTETDLRSRREIDSWCLWADMQARLVKDLYVESDPPLAPAPGPQAPRR